MAFKEYRIPCKNLKARGFDIERFACDVFAYMLPICGFPEAKIPTTNREENVYIESDFIKNVGLSVMPIALYMRDDWKGFFEIRCEKGAFGSILEVGAYLESVLVHYNDFHEEDYISKVQFSLAIYNEFFLFFNYKGIETFMNSLPISWKQCYEQLIDQSEDFRQTFESSLIMHNEITERWISKFMRSYAIPYGSTEEVSEKFSLYAFEYYTENDNCPEEISNEGVDVFLPDVVQVSKDKDIKSDRSSTEDFKVELCNLPDRCQFQNYSHRMQEYGDEDSIESKARGSHTNGLAYALRHCLKGRKRSRSQKLGVEDAFREISLDKENVLPEDRDTKRRRKASSKEKLE